MTIIELNKKFIPFPTEWNELSQNQLLDLMDCLLLKQYTEAQVQLKLFKILANLNYWQFFRSKPTEMAEYFYLSEFLSKYPTGFTKQLIPVYDKLHGPADDFDNMIMKELALCENYFMAWADDRENMELLNMLCALLYRPMKEKYDLVRNPDGDPREEFNQNLSEYRAKKQISKWPLRVKLAIAYWYDGCRCKLVEDNDEVFGGNSGQESKYGLVSVMLQVAEEGALGDFTSVEKHYAKTVMLMLNESIHKAKEMEKQMKK